MATPIENEDALIAEVKAGDERAFEKLAVQYISLISILSSAYKAEGYDTQDFNQEGLMCLYVAAQNYDGERDASFKNYALICIKNRFLTIIRSQNRKKDIPKAYLQPIDEISEEDFADSKDNPENILLNSEAYIHLVNKMKDKLSTFEFEVLSLYLKGYSYEEISDTLSSNNKAVDNALFRIRNKLSK